MSKLLLDSWAWLELFQGSEKGRQVLDLVKKAEGVFTTTANVYEVMYRVRDDKGEAASEEKKEFIQHHAVIQDITLEVAVSAVGLRKKEKLAAMDSFALAGALLLDAKLVTGDPDFKNVKNIVYLGL